MTSVPNLIFWQAILTAPSFWFLRHVARHILICQSSPLGRMEKKERQRWTFVNVKGTRQERTKGPFLAILSNSAVFLHSSYPNTGTRVTPVQQSPQPTCLQRLLTCILFQVGVWPSSCGLAASCGCIFRFSLVLEAVGLSFHFSAPQLSALHKTQVLLSPWHTF